MTHLKLGFVRGSSHKSNRKYLSYIYMSSMSMNEYWPVNEIISFNLISEMDVQ